VANNLVKAVTMQTAKQLIGNPALTNNYLVEIPQLPNNEKDHPYYRLANHILIYGKMTDNQFVSRKLGFLCSEASLPTSSYATAEVKDNFIGVTQEFAHTRLYADTDFTFYVDNNYDSIKFFEAWMDFISGTGPAQNTSKGYFRRMNYPDNYKVSEMKIYKFERDISRVLEYKFINAFPKGMTSIPVSYGAADLLKVTVSFNYDRYIMNFDFTKEFDNAILNKALTTREPFEDPRIPGTTIFPAGGVGTSKELEDINAGRIPGVPGVA